MYLSRDSNMFPTRLQMNIGMVVHRNANIMLRGPSRSVRADVYELKRNDRQEDTYHTLLTITVSMTIDQNTHSIV